MKRNGKSKGLGIFAMLAALLGISAGCKGGSQDIVCMYGVPTVSYELKGKVTDEAGKPVEGIEVSLERMEPGDSTGVGYTFGPIVMTDGEGLWCIRTDGDPAPSIKAIYQDIDGSANGGLFAPDSTVIKGIEPVKSQKDNNPFNLGEVKQEFPAMKMKKAK